MKKIKAFFLTICLAFVGLFALVGCSGATSGYADTINNAYKKGTPVTYVEAKKTLGDECIDITAEVLSVRNGILVAVKGYNKDNYEEKLNTADENTKFDFIVITVVGGNCTYAHFASGTAAEVKSAIVNGKTNKQ